MSVEKKAVEAEAKRPVAAKAVEQPVEKLAEKSEKSALVSVKNLTGTFFVQPSTQIRIGGHETKELKADGWLENQIAAGLLAKA